MTGVAGQAVRERRVPRATGLPVVCIDAEHEESPVEAEEGRWVTICEEHGTSIHHGTWRTARSFLAVPEEWCEECRAIVDAGEGPEIPEGNGFTEEERRRGIEKRQAAAREREAAEEEARRAAAVQRDLGDQWQEWAMGMPTVPPIWAEADRAEAERLRVLQLAATGEARKARAALRTAERRAEEAEEDAYAAKGKKLKEARKRAEGFRAEMATQEATAAAQELERDECRSARDRLARRAYAAGLRSAGYGIRRNGIGWVVTRGRTEIVRVPDDWLPETELREAKR